MQAPSRVVLYNPAAGGGERLDEVRAAFEERGLAARWIQTTAADSGTSSARRAVEDGADVLIAVGGDGTVRACARAVLGSDVPLGIIPLGTGNLLARNLGIPVDPGEASDVVLGGRVRRIDVGSANGETFVAVAGMGLDARMMAAAAPELKARFGSLAYVATAFRHLRRRPFPVELELDGDERRVYRSTMVLVGNMGELPGGLAMFPEADPADGWLEVLIVEASGVWGWLKAIAAVMARRARGPVHYHRARRIRIESAFPEPWEVDGDERPPVRRLELAVTPAALGVLVPSER